jgi:hypothetical protein
VKETGGDGWCDNTGDAGAVSSLQMDSVELDAEFAGQGFCVLFTLRRPVGCGGLLAHFYQAVLTCDDGEALKDDKLIISILHSLV